MLVVVPEPKPGEFKLIGKKLELEGVRVELVAVAGTGEITYRGGGPLRGTAVIDPEAVRINLSPYAILAKGGHDPGVFIRETGGDSEWPPTEWDEWGRIVPRTFSVVGSRPHVAVKIEGLTANHRILVGSELVEEDSDFYRAMRTKGNFGHLYIRPLTIDPAKRELRIVIQRARWMSFDFAVPATVSEGR